MWNYEKRLQYPVNITQTNPKMALYIMSQYGGPNLQRRYVLQITGVFLSSSGAK